MGTGDRFRSLDRRMRRGRGNCDRQLRLCQCRRCACALGPARGPAAGRGCSRRQDRRGPADRLPIRQPGRGPQLRRQKREARPVQRKRDLRGRVPEQRQVRAKLQPLLPQRSRVVRPVYAAQAGVELVQHVQGQLQHRGRAFGMARDRRHSPVALARPAGRWVLPRGQSLCPVPRDRGRRRHCGDRQGVLGGQRHPRLRGRAR